MQKLPTSTQVIIDDNNFYCYVNRSTNNQNEPIYNNVKLIYKNKNENKVIWKWVLILSKRNYIKNNKHQIKDCKYNSKNYKQSNQIDYNRIKITNNQLPVIEISDRV